MIYTKAAYEERQRMLSGEGNRGGAKSPIKIIRLSTSPVKVTHSSPTKIITSSPDQPLKVINQPYQYSQTVQPSSNKLAYYTQSPPKVSNPQPQPNYVKTNAPNKAVSCSSNKPMTLRQRLWAKHKFQPIDQYNIWDGHESQSSIPQQQNPKHIKIPASTIYSPTRGIVQRKSILKQGPIHRIVNENQKPIKTYQQQKHVIFRH